MRYLTFCGPFLGSLVLADLEYTSMVICVFQIEVLFMIKYLLLESGTFANS